MLSQNEIWEGIVHGWATPDDIIAFIDNYIESEHYAALSNHDQLDIDNFRRLIDYSLDEAHGTYRLLYKFVESKLGNYGWNLND